MRGNAIGKPEMLLEPLLVVLSPDANCLRPICPGDHCHDRNNQEVTEYMQAINMRPRILQIFKTGKNRINVIELDLGHKRRLSKGNWGRISAPIYHCQKTARAQLALDSLSNPECALAVARMVARLHIETTLLIDLDIWPSGAKVIDARFRQLVTTKQPQPTQVGNID